MSHAHQRDPHLSSNDTRDENARAAGRKLTHRDVRTSTHTHAQAIEDSFSRRCKHEILEQQRGEVELDEELTYVLMFSGQFIGGEIRLTLANGEYLHSLQPRLEHLLDCRSEIIPGRGLHKLLVRDRSAYQRLRKLMRERRSFDCSRGRLLGPVKLTDGERLSPLRALFLSCASIADPQKAYHLEFTVRRPTVAQFAHELLGDYGIRASLIRRYGANVLYVKEGQQIADLLGELGASLSLLYFEETRVEKDVNNTINRMVNCDSANARRVAASSARQCALLTALRGHKAFKSLPEELRKTAELRIDNPGMSISELGAAMNPPLGKSGVYHRLRRLETLARELDLAESDQ